MNESAKKASSLKGINKLKADWPNMNLFERFEHLVMLFVSAILVVIILAALLRLVENVYELAVAQISGETDFKTFQITFGMLLTLLIAFEFRNSIDAILEGKGLLFQVKIVILIAIIALARKFLMLDPKEYDAVSIAAYALVALSLGVVYWLLNRPASKNDELQHRL